MFSDLGFSKQKMYFFFKKLFGIVNEGSSLMIVNNGLSLTIFMKGSYTPQKSGRWEGT